MNKSVESSKKLKNGKIDYAYFTNQEINKNKLLNLAPKNNSLPSNLNIFNKKLNKFDLNNRNLKGKVEDNFAGKPKHYPPANKEWFNSVYTYNKNSNKLLPVSDKVVYKLLKSYFNLYSHDIEKRRKSRRIRPRVRRLSINRILVSKAELKHTNDKVIITIYVYNRQNKYYLNKIKKIASIDMLSNWLSNLKINIIRKKSLKLRSKISKHQKRVWKMLNLNNKVLSPKLVNDNKFKNYHVKYLKDYVSKCLRKEIFSFYFRQMLFFNKSKFEERYLLPLTRLTENIYKKKIEYNIVNLKYLYLNSHIFSETLITKIRNRKNKLLRVLKTSLLMFKIPPMDRTAVYDEIYNKKRKLQNPKINKMVSHAYFTNKHNLNLDLKNKVQDKDVLQLSLPKIDYSNSLYKLKDHDMLISQSNKLNPNSTHYNYPLDITNTILNFIKNKHVSGIRIEAAGRLTRRNTAARSVFKLRYKGNIKNMDSSYKGLSSVLLRGHAKSNLQYTNLKSKKRIGSFGLKSWVSSS